MTDKQEIEMGFGEEIIGNFNPNEREDVAKIKHQAADLINTIKDAVDEEDGCVRRRAIAVTHIEQAAMMGIKALYS